MIGYRKYYSFVVGISYLSVLKCGHHYQEAQDDTISAIFEACTNTIFTPNVANVDMFRTALHPLGLLALEDMYDELDDQGKIAEAIKLRVNSPPQGYAMVGHVLTAMN